jgi:hypothetical protein
MLPESSIKVTPAGVLEFQLLRLFDRFRLLRLPARIDRINAPGAA